MLHEKTKSKKELHQVDKNILFHPSMRNSSFHEKDARERGRRKKQMMQRTRRIRKEEEEEKRKREREKKGVFPLSSVENGDWIPPFSPIPAPSIVCATRVSPTDTRGWKRRGAREAWRRERRRTRGREPKEGFGERFLPSKTGAFMLFIPRHALHRAESTTGPGPGPPTCPFEFGIIWDTFLRRRVPDLHPTPMHNLPPSLPPSPSAKRS